MRLLVVLVLIITVVGCQSGGEEKKSKAKIEQTRKEIDIQGHRGARGILPENSIRGFIKAIDLGVNTLELDLCITKDKQVIVSHEPYISSEICLDPDRNMISPEQSKEFNIYEMDYDEVREFDCGSLMHARFPSQGKVKVVKPLLSEVFNRVEDYIRSNNLDPVGYNIELKSREDYDNLYHPEPSEFSKLVFEEIGKSVDWSRVTIQSFDFRILRHFKENYPEVRLSQLIENERSWQENIEELGFKPDIYSCYFEVLTPDAIEGLQSENIKVIPWTVNEVDEMQKLIDWGVDGIITDYPDKAQELNI